MNRNIVAQKKMKPGKYVITDPCYQIGIKKEFMSWGKLCEEIFCHKDKKHGGVFSADGFEFAYFGTAHGDGAYYDQHGNRYFVDAGIIGCIPYEYCQALDEKLYCGSVHEFKKPFICEYKDGKIRFGDVVINTDNDEETYYNDDEE